MRGKRSKNRSSRRKPVGRPDLGLSPALTRLVAKNKELGDAVTSDVQVFLDRADRLLVGQRITKVECKPVMIPGDPFPYKGYTVHVENGSVVTFLGPQVVGIGEREQMDDRMEGAS